MVCILPINIISTVGACSYMYMYMYMHVYKWCLQFEEVSTPLMSYMYMYMYINLGDKKVTFSFRSAPSRRK